MPEFPIESLKECIQSILNKKIKESQTLKTNLSTENLPRVLIKFYKLFNGFSTINKNNNINHFNFNQFHMFKLI